MARSTSDRPSKRYRVYRARTMPGFAAFCITPEWFGKPGNIWAFDGFPKGRKWVPPDVFVMEPLLPPWDVSLLHGEIIMTPEARKTLEGHLSAYGRGLELLPLVHEGREYTVLNCTYVGNVLNRQASKFRPTGSIEEYVFYPKRWLHSIFKIPEEAKGSVFIAEDMERPYWSFKWQIEQNKLKGLKWKLIWEGD